MNEASKELLGSAERERERGKKKKKKKKKKKSQRYRTFVSSKYNFYNSYGFFKQKNNYKNIKLTVKLTKSNGRT